MNDEGASSWSSSRVKHKPPYTTHNSEIGPGLQRKQNHKMLPEWNGKAAAPGRLQRYLWQILVTPLGDEFQPCSAYRTRALMSASRVHSTRGLVYEFLTYSVAQTSLQEQLVGNFSPSHQSLGVSFNLRRFGDLSVAKIQTFNLWLSIFHPSSSRHRFHNQRNFRGFLHLGPEESRALCVGRGENTPNLQLGI